MDRPRSRWWLAVALLAGLAIPITACDVSQVTVEIPDFQSSQVEGLWLWHLSDQTGQYERLSQVTFDSNPQSAVDSGTITYTIVAPDGQHEATILSAITPSTTNPDSVTLTLYVERANQHGSFRVSTFNAAGESPLSSASITM